MRYFFSLFLCNTQDLPASAPPLFSQNDCCPSAATTSCKSHTHPSPHALRLASPSITATPPQPPPALPHLRRGWQHSNPRAGYKAPPTAPVLPKQRPATHPLHTQPHTQKEAAESMPHCPLASTPRKSAPLGCSFLPKRWLRLLAAAPCPLHFSAGIEHAVSGGGGGAKKRRPRHINLLPAIARRLMCTPRQAGADATTAAAASVQAHPCHHPPPPNGIPAAAQLNARPTQSAEP